MTNWIKIIPKNDTGRRQRFNSRHDQVPADDINLQWKSTSGEEKGRKEVLEKSAASPEETARLRNRRNCLGLSSGLHARLDCFNQDRHRYSCETVLRGSSVVRVPISNSVPDGSWRFQPRERSKDATRDRGENELRVVLMRER